MNAEERADNRSPWPACADCHVEEDAPNSVRVTERARERTELRPAEASPRHEREPSRKLGSRCERAGREVQRTLECEDEREESEQ
jgi:hypothetical protein